MAKKKAQKKGKKAKVQLELSDWQLMRVRNALRAYHRYEKYTQPEKDLEERFLTWRDVREAIGLYTGTNIGTDLKSGAEILRKFVEGTKSRTPGEHWMFPKPQPEALAAIVSFVTEPELNLLTTDELTEDLAGPQAPLRLLEFMRDGVEILENEMFRHLEGHYLTALQHRDGWNIRSLLLQRHHDGGLLQVMELRDHYNTDTPKDALEWFSDEGKDVQERRISRDKYAGWAVLTPEDSLLLFLKRNQDGKNHRYLCLEEVGLWLQAVPHYIDPKDADEGIKIPMMEHEFGHDLQGANVDEIARTLRSDVYIFSKLSGSAS